MLTPLSAMQTLGRARDALQSGRGAGLPELLKLIESLSTNIGEATISEIAELIEKDAAVLSRVLTIANTIIHNPNVQPMASIPHAIHQIGFQRVRSLAVSLMLIENTGSAGNPPEQREAAAQALCAGLLAQGCAHGLGTVDPELAFACAALRQFGQIILPAVSLEHYRAAKELAKTKSEDVAFRTLYGLAPLELSRRLLGTAKLPEEVLQGLRDCQPESMRGVSASTYGARLLGVADFGVRLAGLALDAANNTDLFAERSRNLARKYERLIPGVGETVESALAHTDERIGSFTRTGGRSLDTPGLKRIKSRVQRETPFVEALPPSALETIAGEVAPDEAPLENTLLPATTDLAVPTGADLVIAAAPAEEAPLADQPGTDGVTSAAPGQPEVEAAAPTPPEPPKPAVWTDTLAQSKSFETQGAAAGAETDPWSASLTFVRDSFGAQECWVFVAAPGGESLPIVQGVGRHWQDFRARAALRPDERTVFGVCLARRENVVIHDTTEATLRPYLPAWFRETKGAPGAFLLMPLHDGQRAHSLVLIGWHQPHRITVTAAQTDLARQLFATVAGPKSAAVK